MAEMDPRLVRLVTRHFNDLHGLNATVVGLAQVGVSAVWLCFSDPASTMLSAMAVCLPFIYAMRRLDRYYVENFGRVAHAAFRYRGIVVLAGLAWGLSGDTLRWWVFWAFIGGESLWRLVDGWPYRFQELFVISAVLSAIALVSQHGTAALAQCFFLFGLAQIVTGLADHHLLVRAMRATQERRSAYADTV